MKRFEHLKTLDFDGWVKFGMEEDNDGFIDLACKRKMQTVRNDELPCHNRDSDDCFREVCKGCVIDYLNEEVDDNGQAVDDDGGTVAEHNGCSQRDS